MSKEPDVVDMRYLEMMGKMVGEPFLFISSRLEILYTNHEAKDLLGIQTSEELFLDDLTMQQELSTNNLGISLIASAISQKKCITNFPVSINDGQEGFLSVEPMYTPEDDFLGSCCKIALYQEKYRDIFQSISEGYLVLDVKGVCIDANPSAAKLLKEQDNSALIGSNFFRKYFVNPRDLKIIKEKMYESQRLMGVKILLKRRDGSHIVSDFNLTIKQNGPELQIQGSFRDITRDVELSDYIISAMVEAEDNARRVIAQNLHDGVQQTLIASTMNFRAISDKIGNDLSNCYKRGLQLLQQGINEIRHVSHDLIPHSVEISGLSKAIGTMVSNMTLPSGAIKLEFLSNLNGHRFPKTIEIGVYRIVQEALNNILKYSEARHGIIMLNFLKDRNTLKLNIKDDGVGFDYVAESVNRNGYGIIGMQNRAVSIGGKFEMKSSVGNGTVVGVEIQAVPIDE